jgi:hypothetical protein
MAAKGLIDIPFIEQILRGFKSLFCPAFVDQVNGA